VPPAVRDHLLAGGTDPEHRQATVAFVLVSGVDDAVGATGAEAVAAAFDELIRDTQRAAAAHGVSFLGTDIAADGAKIILAAGVRATALTPFRVKGKAQPVQSHIVGPLLTERRIDRARRIVGLRGRRDEVAVLVEAAGDARRGHGRIVQLVGEPGVGKTRLIEELLASTDDMAVVSLRGEVYRGSTPYRLIARMLQAAV